MTKTSSAIEGVRAALWWRRFYAAVLFLFGAALLAGGVMLVIDGGSFYDVLAGLSMKTRLSNKIVAYALPR